MPFFQVLSISHQAFEQGNQDPEDGVTNNSKYETLQMASPETKRC
jgi:hypothetical protein